MKSKKASTSHALEILEARIAPAATAIATADILPATVGGYNLLQAGQGLGTAGENSGTYLLYVEKGTAIVFNTDFNNNGVVDFNEITGIAAGDGLRLISFVDIHGDIVTNLDADRTLSDSNNNSADDVAFGPLQGDGRVLNNSRIEKIEMRSLTRDDLVDQNGDGVVDDTDVSLRLALSSYSIFGNIYAGRGFGVPGDSKSGLIIDDAGRALQQSEFAPGSVDFFYDFRPQVDWIKTGSAASNEYFSFGASRGRDVQGFLTTFTAPSGQVGGDIVGVKSANAALLQTSPTAQVTSFNIAGLMTGKGGIGARGGNIQDVILSGDTAGGYQIIAGDGGDGPVGGAGGALLNFQDVSSTTGYVVLQSGNGGTGTAGAGGNGGALTLGTFNVSAAITILPGNGGDGFTGGGAGASLNSVRINTPEITPDRVISIVGTTHDTDHDPVSGVALNRLQDPTILDPVTNNPYTLGQLGRTRAVDFNRDGFGDIVYVTDNPDQLVVKLGNGFGGFQATPINLDAMPFQGAGTTPDVAASMVTVGDFNGDGFMDVAAASNVEGNFDGIVVYLARTSDVDLDGDLDFVGFRSGIHSTMPALYTFNDQVFGNNRSAVPITSITAGDFNGDGFTDIAAASTYTYFNGGRREQIVMFFVSDVEPVPGTSATNPVFKPTGRFFADFGTKASGEPPAGANPIRPFYSAALNNSGPMKLEASALSTSSDRDIVVATIIGGDNVRIIDAFPFAGVNPGEPRQGSVNGPLVVPSPLGRVDLNRSLGPQDQIVGATMRDFTLLDSNNDGLLDLAVVTNQIGSDGRVLMVAKLGNGVTFSTFLTNNGVNNAGFSIAGPPVGADGSGIRAADADGDGNFDNVAIFDRGSGAWAALIHDLDDVAPDGVVANPGATYLGLQTGFLSGGTPAFDVYYPVVANSAAPGYIGNGVAGGGPQSFVTVNPSVFFDAADHFITFDAGDGGDAKLGRGGAGGSLGGGRLTYNSLLDTVSGAIQIVLPQSSVSGDMVTLRGGLGGNGFTTGGAGGSVSGVAIGYASGTIHSSVEVYGGDGGFGVTGAGGAGGSLFNNSIVSGDTFIAGDGGRGAIGGAGGSVRGNGTRAVSSVLFDAQDPFVTVRAGNGADGVRRGGDGGDISGFAAQFSIFTGTSATGLLDYRGGNGGNAVAGPGGRGGSILSVSPVIGENRLSGDIQLQGGNGGTGLSGGAGGSVANFVNRPSTSDNPAVLTVIGGEGGAAIRGVGGRGGDVQNIDVPGTVGVPNPSAPSSSNGFTFNRILSGNGGLSAGGTGGAGGNISRITAANSDNPFAIAAGKGGDGLRRGGNGGSVSDLQVEVGGTSLAKLLVVAGAGGDATAFLANPLDPLANQGDKAFGGMVGVGGNGGNITNVVQGRVTNGLIGGNINARVDLIAGNGGDTVNFGTTSDPVITVGRGGSITGVNIAGTLGNVQSNVPIKSYNRELQGETMADFVDTNLRDPLTPGSIDDSVGNVGLVAGSAGRLKSVVGGFGGTGEIIFRSQPARSGINGSVTNVTATEIMSMIAGSVERIASIQRLGGIRVVGTGDVGSDKAPSGSIQFLSPSGAIIPEPTIDGRLLDGALIYRQLGGAVPTGSVFQLA